MPFGTTRFVLRLDPATEEWAEDLLQETDDRFGVGECERTDDALIVRGELGGNLDAVSAARSFLSDVEEAFDEGMIEPRSLSLSVSWEPRDEKEARIANVPWPPETIEPSAGSTGSGR